MSFKKIISSKVNQADKLIKKKLIYKKGKDSQVVLKLSNRFYGGEIK